MPSPSVQRREFAPVKKIVAASRDLPASDSEPSPASPQVAAPPPAVEQRVPERAVESRAPEEPPDALRLLRLNLAREARRHRNYPLIARERGWTGTAEVILEYGSRDEAPQVSLGRSSGHAILDRAALETLARAAAAAGLPEGLRGRSLRIAVPVAYSLEDSEQR